MIELCEVDGRIAFIIFIPYQLLRDYAQWMADKDARTVDGQWQLPQDRHWVWGHMVNWLDLQN